MEKNLEKFNTFNSYKFDTWDKKVARKFWFHQALQNFCNLHVNIPLLETPYLTEIKHIISVDFFKKLVYTGKKNLFTYKLIWKQRYLKSGKISLWSCNLVFRKVESFDLLHKLACLSPMSVKEHLYNVKLCHLNCKTGLSVEKA